MCPIVQVLSVDKGKSFALSLNVKEPRFYLSLPLYHSLTGVDWNTVPHQSTNVRAILRRGYFLILRHRNSTEETFLKNPPKAFQSLFEIFEIFEGKNGMIIVLRWLFFSRNSVCTFGFDWFLSGHSENRKGVGDMIVTFIYSEMHLVTWL